ncbi:hypothetical protein [Paenibacillus sp. FSL E2-0178]|uniref:hypothetical protein n=1 Tax=Paenibacillus sp. FSL E2-0178 TaxID=2921361 RepID=UPI00315978DF
MDFKSMKDLEKYLNEQIAKSLENDVGSGVARAKLKENIQSEVYDKYDPVMYQRDGETGEGTGGLIGDANILVGMVDKNTVSIESHRMDNGRNVGVVVETGVGYNPEWKFPYTNKGRPFTEVTRDKLRNDGSVEHAIANGLKRQGLDVQ